MQAETVFPTYDDAELKRQLKRRTRMTVIAALPWVSRLLARAPLWLVALLTPFIPAEAVDDVTIIGIWNDPILLFTVGAIITRFIVRHRSNQVMNDGPQDR